VSPQVSAEVVETINYLKRRAGFPVGRSLEVLRLSRATYFRWANRGGKEAHPEVVVPKGHWLIPEEREAIIAYKRTCPEVGYRRLSYQMLDAGVVAVAPSSVYRVLREAGLSSRWTPTAHAGTHKEGFEQPERPHEQWHTDIAYLNILGTHYFFLAVLDGFSRFIVHHEVRLDMTVRDVEIVLERALEKLPEGVAPPRLITDNGSQYLSGEFKDYLKERDISHSRTRVGHPQSNGKIERFHKRLKEECVRVTPMADLEEARDLIARYVEDYNLHRLHSALGHLTPWDYLQGQEHIQARLQARRDALRQAARVRRMYWQSTRKAT
jgi:transposase InsO family protein